MICARGCPGSEHGKSLAINGITFQQGRSGGLSPILELLALLATRCFAWSYSPTHSPSTPQMEPVVPDREKTAGTAVSITRCKAAGCQVPLPSPEELTAERPRFLTPRSVFSNCPLTDGDSRCPVNVFAGVWGKQFFISWSDATSRKAGERGGCA